MSADLAKKLWDRYDKEPELWYKRFLTYLRMDPINRDLHDCYIECFKAEGKKVGDKTPKGWNDSFESFRWNQRAEAYDLDQTKKTEKQHKAFRDTVRTDMESLVQDMIARAKDMLAFPLEQRIVEEETGTVIIMPVNHKASDIPHYLRSIRDMSNFIISQDDGKSKSSGVSISASGGSKFSVAGTIENTDVVKAEVVPEYEEMSNEQLMIYVMDKITGGIDEDFG